MKKRFIFLMATMNYTVEWSGNETLETLTTRRFPPTDTEHESVKSFCEKAKVGSFMQTKYNFIVCVECKETEKETK